MSFTYDETDLDENTSSGRLNIVRLLLGDTNSLDQQLQDEEINFSLSMENDNPHLAASKSARYISAKYARLVDVELDGQLREDYSQLRYSYSELAENLYSEYASSKAALGISSGGISTNEMERVRCDKNRPKSFYVGQFKNRGV